jgi:hypothetical protein
MVYERICCEACGRVLQEEKRMHHDWMIKNSMSDIDHSDLVESSKVSPSDVLQKIMNDKKSRSFMAITGLELCCMREVVLYVDTYFGPYTKYL